MCIRDRYNDTYQENIYTFANNIHTPEGGTHLTGFSSALTRSINEYGRQFGFLKASDANLKSEDVRESLAAVISVKLVEPQFEGQTKSKLGNSEVRGIVAVSYTHLDVYKRQGLTLWAQRLLPVPHVILKM